MATKRKFTIPKNLAAAADMYYLIRNERLAASKAVEPLAEFERKLHDHIINTLPKSKAGGIAGKLVRVEIDKQSVPTMKDKKKFVAYCTKTNQLDMLTIGMNAKAVKERWENKKVVPGIDKFTVVKLKMNRLKGGK